MATVRMLIPYMNVKSRFEATVSRLEPQGDAKVELLHVFGIPESLSWYGDADILVARGMTYDRLRHLLPEKYVVEIQSSSFDILKVLICARQELRPKKITLCVRYMDDSAASELEKLCQVEIAYYTVHDEVSTLEIIHRARTDGADVFVGAGTMCELCDKESLNWVYIRTEGIAIEQVLKQATDAARTINMKRARSEMTSTILNTSTNVLIVVSGSGLIQALNNQVYCTFGLSSQADYIGRSAEEVCPVPKWKHVVETGREQEEVIQWKDRKLYMEYRLVLVDKMGKGAIIAACYTEQIIRAETKVRQSFAKQGLTAKYFFDDIIGNSPAIWENTLVARRYSRVDSNVLTASETGAGKELFAHSIHREDRCSAESFVALNCVALPENLLESEFFGYELGASSGVSKSGKTGLFKLAHKGTTFLDEIEEIPISFQTKLLRVLQERETRHIGSDWAQPVDMRVISATNINIGEKTRKEQFRTDLYCRLNLLDVTIPPFRERGGDIREMADFYLTRLTHETGKPISRLSREAVDLMAHYGWPGNVRELRNICECLVALSDITEIGLRGIQMPEIFRKKEGPPPGAGTSAKERVLPETGIVYVSLEPRKKKQDIAKKLGVSRTVLWHMEKMTREQKKQ